MVGVLAGTVEDALIVYSAISAQLPSDQPITQMHHKVHLPLLNLPNCMRKVKLAKYDKVCNIISNSGSVIALMTLNFAVLMLLISSRRSMDGRNRQLQIHQKIFDQADVIVTPTTGVTAYTIQDDALKTGEPDYINGAALVCYMIAGNFLGLPAITIPVGYEKCGLPIGLQFIGKPWSEASLIYIAYAVQWIYWVVPFIGAALTALYHVVVIRAIPFKSKSWMR